MLTLPTTLSSGRHTEINTVSLRSDTVLTDMHRATADGLAHDRRIASNSTGSNQRHFGWQRRLKCKEMRADRRSENGKSLSRDVPSALVAT
jgi:hypothetical protein